MFRLVGCGHADDWFYTLTTAFGPGVTTSYYVFCVLFVLRRRKLESAKFNSNQQATSSKSLRLKPWVEGGPIDFEGVESAPAADWVHILTMAVV